MIYDNVIRECKKAVIGEIREGIEKQGVRSSAIDGIAFYSATDIDNLLDTIEEENYK